MRQQHMQSSKVKSHLPFKAMKEGIIALEDYTLNTLADTAADVAAELAQPGVAYVNEFRKWQAVAYKVPTRIAWIEAWHWER